MTKVKVRIKKTSNSEKPLVGKGKNNRRLFLCISIFILLYIVLAYAVCISRYDNMPYDISILCSVFSLMLGLSSILFLLDIGNNQPDYQKKKGEKRKIKKRKW